ncbi:PGAP1-like protein [compost metagenome]
MTQVWGRFINEDTYEGQIDNPLTLNLYTYVHNNPLKYADPTGNKAWLIHGTFAKPTTWTDEFRDYIGGVFNELYEALKWSGKNKDEARVNAADELVVLINDWHVKNPDEPIRLIGHSHGGNVSSMIANKLAEKGKQVDTLITIATPVREYQLETTVGQHINVYNNHDSVQIYGGNVTDTTLRSFENAENVKVKLPFWRWASAMSVSNHSYMHSNVGVWKEYIESLLKKD